MGFYEDLAGSFPEEETPFGVCLLVPPSSFKSEWETQLKAEGVKVFQQSYNGRLFFFLKKPGSAPSEDAFNAKPSEWSGELVERLKALKAQGLGYRTIAKQLGISRDKVYRKIRELEGQRLEAANREGADDGVFQEYLEASKLLYPRYRRACALLLREASRALENG